jgi:hypothetical protein
MEVIAPAAAGTVKDVNFASNGRFPVTLLLSQVGPGLDGLSGNSFLKALISSAFSGAIKMG